MGVVPFFYSVFNGITRLAKMMSTKEYKRDSYMPLPKPFMCSAPQGPFKVITDVTTLEQIKDIQKHLMVAITPQATLHDKYLIACNIRKNYLASHMVKELNVYFFDVSMIWGSVLSKPPSPKLRREFWEKVFCDSFQHALDACETLLLEAHIHKTVRKVVTFG